MDLFQALVHSVHEFYNFTTDITTAGAQPAPGGADQDREPRHPVLGAAHTLEIKQVPACRVQGDCDQALHC